MLRLRVSGTITILPPLYAFITCTETTLPFYYCITLAREDCVTFLYIGFVIFILQMAERVHMLFPTTELFNCNSGMWHCDVWYLSVKQHGITCQKTAVFLKTCLQIWIAVYKNNYVISYFEWQTVRKYVEHSEHTWRWVK